MGNSVVILALLGVVMVPFLGILYSVYTTWVNAQSAESSDHQA
jgi:hypothetical protein